MEHVDYQVAIIKASKDLFEDLDQPLGSYSFAEWLDDLLNYDNDLKYHIKQYLNRDPDKIIDGLNSTDLASVINQVSHWYLKDWQNRLV